MATHVQCGPTRTTRIGLESKRIQKCETKIRILSNPTYLGDGSPHGEDARGPAHGFEQAVAFKVTNGAVGISASGRWLFMFVFVQKIGIIYFKIYIFHNCVQYFVVVCLEI